MIKFIAIGEYRYNFINILSYNYIPVIQIPIMYKFGMYKYVKNHW